MSGVGGVQQRNGPAPPGPISEVNLFRDGQQLIDLNAERYLTVLAGCRCGAAGPPKWLRLALAQTRWRKSRLGGCCAKWPGSGMGCTGVLIQTGL